MNRSSQLTLHGTISSYYTLVLYLYTDTGGVRPGIKPWPAQRLAFQTQHHRLLPRQVTEEIQNLDLSASRTLNFSIPFFKLLGVKDIWFVY
jgi:hypothetical protein